jgi:hypothetical protein
LFRDAARELLAGGIDPSQAKNSGKQIKAGEAANTFEVVARTWLTKTAAMRAGSTQEKITAWIEQDLLPSLGKMPISSIGQRDVPATVQKTSAPN